MIPFLKRLKALILKVFMPIVGLLPSIILIIGMIIEMYIVNFLFRGIKVNEEQSVYCFKILSWYWKYWDRI